MSDQSVTIGLRVTPDLRDRINSEADRLTVGRNLLLNRAVEVYLLLVENARGIYVQRDGSGGTRSFAEEWPVGRHEATTPLQELMAQREAYRDLNLIGEGWNPGEMRLDA